MRACVLDMREEDPIPTFTYLVNKLKEKHSDLAYIHVVSPGAPGGEGPKDPSVRRGGMITRTVTKSLINSPAYSKWTSSTISGSPAR